MELRILEIAQSSDWCNALEQVHGADIYYTPGYLIPHAQRGEGRPILVVGQKDGKTAVHVCFVRKLSSLPFDAKEDASLVDLISPYGYAGPLLSHPDEEFAKEFWTAWKNAARQMGVVSEFIRFHPLLDNHEIFEGTIPSVHYGQTVYIDLTRKRIVDGLSNSCRKCVRTAYNKGGHFELLNPVEWLEDFVDMYTKTMDQHQASSFYYFDEDYFVRLFDELQDKVWLARVHYKNRTGAFGLFLVHNQFLHYHLGCSDYELRAFCPTNLLLYEAALLARKREQQAFHLGGGFGDSESQKSLFDFKHRFSDRTADYYYAKVTHNPDAYARLTAASSSSEDNPFFPAYRSLS